MTIETDRLISPVGNTEDRVIDKAIRPKRLADYVGQPRTREQMEIFISAAKLRHEALDHLLIFGPPGLGKCITANSTILTDSGWIQMSSLIPDNMADDTYHELSIPIYGLEGIENTSHIYSNGIQDTIRITTRAGFSIEGTVNHPVWAEGSIWKCLGELTLQDKVGIAINMSIKEPHDLRAMFSNDKIFTSSCDYMRTQIQLDLCIFGVIAQRKEDNLFLEEEIKDSTTYWDYIDKIEYGRAPVYDFCVPGTHSFVANGFYNHNTTLANIIASEMDVNIRQTSGPVLERAGDLAAILTNLEK
ncbi:MAG: hypothetical protein KAH77_00715, partial [Thiomargarita sp.]|nr:hypothetical protein [Thiomargarita sp.]